MGDYYRPEFATNRIGAETVAGTIEAYWQSYMDDGDRHPDIAIASAYFNPGGWHLLADQLERAGKVRLLLGAEPDVGADMFKARRLGGLPTERKVMQRRLRDALTDHHHDMAEDRNLIGFNPNEDAKVQRLIDWLRCPEVEVRRLETQFLHGKAYILETNSEHVLVGSSNLTYAGLMRNVELNLGQSNRTPVDRVRDWFDDLWERSAAYTDQLIDLYEQRFVEHDPYLVFLRMLWEMYGDRIDGPSRPLTLPLLPWQKEGVDRAEALLAQYGGVLVADGVGLGKTYLAGELIRYANRELRQRVLLIAPAALRDGPWAQFFDEWAHEFTRAVDIVSYEQLSQHPALGGDGPVPKGMKYDPDEYALVVIDEAHAYRNTDTDRSKALRLLLAGTPRKRLVLLTATPVNNGLMDLYNLLVYFISNDGAFINKGIPSLRKRFQEAQAINPDDLSPDVLFDVLDEVAVRRTRRFIKKYYPGVSLPGGGVVKFPEPKVVRIDYPLDSLVEITPELDGFFEEFAYALAVDPDDDDSPIPGSADFDYEHALSLARYQPSAFAKNPADLDHREVQAAGLLRSGLLKRFESSAHAFAKTCRKMAESHQQFLDALNDGYVLTGEALQTYVKTDSDDFDPTALDVGGSKESAEKFRVDDLRHAVETDRDMLVGFAARAELITADVDPKIDALIDALADIAKQAKEDSLTDPSMESTNRKVLLFSYYQDTADWIHDHLVAAAKSDPRLQGYADRITVVSGDRGDKADAMFGFAPLSSDAPAGRDDDRYDLLVATDVLAEGVNLQQCRHIINYDLPWNPMRLVQRHGRIDRIGSPHDRIWMRCFFPAELLDRLLGLEAAIQRKIAQAAASIGTEGEIIPGSAVKEHTYNTVKKQIDELADENADIFEAEFEPGALSGEEFRKIVEQARANETLAKKIDTLPWVAGSGFAVDLEAGEQPGFVFCVRVGNHPEPTFRWVPTDANGDLVRASIDPDELLDGIHAPLAVEGMSRETLTALGKAYCEPETDRHLPDAWRQQAYEAWEVARDDIYADWQPKTDRQNLVPRVDKPFRDALDLLRTYPPHGIPASRLDHIKASLNNQADERRLNVVRAALRGDDPPGVKVQRLLDAIETLGLTPPEPVRPLDEIIPDDIHLVCWMALVPKDAADA